MMNASNKLKCLRERMQHHNIDAFIALSADPHMSEYLPDFWKIRQWLTGFTGSVGTLLITQDIAGLWVDGRYWVQAETQLKDTGFSLQKLTSEESSTHWAWLKQNLNKGARVSVNTQTISVQQFEILQNIIEQNQFTIVKDIDLIAEIWKDRPALPIQPIYEMAKHLNALQRLEKIEKIRDVLNTKHIDGHFISAVDDIAWILNCRGADVEYNPVFLSHLYIDQNQVVLFCDAQKLNKNLVNQLNSENMTLENYEESHNFLSNLNAQSVLIDPTKVSYYHQSALNPQIQILHDINPSTRVLS